MPQKIPCMVESRDMSENVCGSLALLSPNRKQSTCPLPVKSVSEQVDTQCENEGTAWVNFRAQC